MAIVLREAVMQDLPALKLLFEKSIRASCQKDYSPAEIEVWVSSIHRKERWEKLMEEQEVIVVEENQLLGFASLKDGHYIDFLYLAPEAQGKGLAQKMLQELEARARADTLSSDISITARPFIERQGFKVIRKNHNARAGEVLINFYVEKSLKKNPDGLG